MKWLRVFVLILLFPVAVSAQVKVDRKPSFVENTHNFTDYVSIYPKRAFKIKKDTSFVVRVTIHTDTNGTASLADIEPKVDRSIYKEFVRIVCSAPQWTPALINNKPVSYDEVFVFDVNLKKNKPAIDIYEYHEPPAKTDPIDFQIYVVGRYADFPGGQKAWAKFLNDNIQYPKAAKHKHTQGLVLIQTVIEKDGSFTDIKVIHDPGDGLGEEALRVLTLSPKWLPYYAAQFKVRSQFVIPVRFSLP